MTEPKTIQDLWLGFRDRGAAPAIIAAGQDGMVTRGFAEIFNASWDFAKNILAHGMERRSVIGLMAANSPAWIEAFFGIVAAGCIVMPIDVQISGEDLQRMLIIGECQLVIAGAPEILRLRDLTPQCKALDVNEVAGAAHEPEPIDVTGLAPVAPANVALLLFTSGTTGLPKAVPLNHANVMSNVMALVQEGIVGPQDRALVPLPFHHAYPLTVGMLTVLASGAAIVLPAGISGPELVEAMRRGKVTALLGVPRLYDALLSSIRTEAAHQPKTAADVFSLLLTLSGRLYRHFGLALGRRGFSFVRARIAPQLQLLVNGGAALSPGAELALNALGWRVLTGYGLTETSPILTFDRADHPRLGAAGQALPGVRLRIAHADAAGIGEIEASGSPVFAGYYHDDIATQKAFTPDGWFRTGDLGRLDADGYLFVTARAAETIVLPSGKKIAPEAAEEAYSEIAVVLEIAVLRSGGGLAALIVPNDDAVREAGAFRLHGLIRDALNERARTLPHYLTFSGFAVTHQPLPRTRLGKLRRHLLPALYERARQQQEPEQDAPLSEADTALLTSPSAASVWKWLQARFPNRKLTLDTSPQLDLGVDSLGWVELTLSLQQTFGFVLTQPQIARIITIRDLLREAVAADSAPQPLPDIPEQQKIWLAPYGAGIRALRSTGEVLLYLVMRSCFRLRVRGGETLPEAPFLLCPNHISYLDAFALAAALPREKLQNTYWAGWTGLLFSSRLRRIFSQAAQIIPVDADRAPAAAIALGADVLARGRALVWFPEGGLSPDGSLQLFQPGIGAVLERSPVPVVPVYISGTGMALPPGRRLPRLARITISFGAPINMADVAPGTAGRAHQRAIAERIQAAVTALRDLPQQG